MCLAVDRNVEEEKRWKTLSNPNCGMTFEMTGAQKRTLPIHILQLANTDVSKRHLEH